MLLQEMTEDNNLIIELSMNRQKYEFPSKVIRKVNQSVLVEPIRINGKILSFQFFRWRYYGKCIYDKGQ